MGNRRNKIFLLKIFSIFSVVRGYNIAVVVLAQYLASIFIFGSEVRALDVILDWKLFLLIFSTSLAIASGYIINNFYDDEKDIINRPNKSMLDRMVSKTTRLRIYFFLNFVSTCIAWIISWKASAFLATYIFLLWFYSHKLKKYPIIGNLIASALVMLPFFAIMIYFKNFNIGIFTHAIYLFLIIWIREIIKDLENMKGDFANNYQTIPVRFGVKHAKIFITILSVFTIIPTYVLIYHFEVGYMAYYFYFSSFILFIFLCKLWIYETYIQYKKLHLLLKMLLFLGIISISLIDPNVIINGKEIIRPLLK